MLSLPRVESPSKWLPTVRKQLQTPPCGGWAACFGRFAQKSGRPCDVLYDQRLSLLFRALSTNRPQHYPGLVWKAADKGLILVACRAPRRGLEWRLQFFEHCRCTLRSRRASKAATHFVQLAVPFVPFRVCRSFVEFGGPRVFHHSSGRLADLAAAARVCHCACTDRRTFRFPQAQQDPAAQAL